MEIKQKTKKNGQVVYTTSLYLGVDAITGKKVRTTITARTKKEVKLKAQHKLAEFNQNGQTVFKEVKVTYYHELAQMWYESHIYGLKPNSVSAMKNILHNHLLPAFGHYRLDKLTPALIQTVVNRWANQAKQKSKSNKRLPGVYANYKLLHAYNKKILQHAVAMQLLETNPAQNILVPKAIKLDSDKVKFLSNDQLKTFLTALDQLEDNFENLYFSTLCKLALATGCRIGELLALEWADIDLNQGVIHITKTLNNQLQVNSPKSKTSQRDVTIDATTIAMLKSYRLKQRVEAMKLGTNLPEVFTNFSGHYTQANKLREQLKRFAKANGLTPFGFHTFRHTHASLLLNAGINYKELQQRLGHSTLAMTMDTYAHLSDDSLKTTATLFEQTLKALQTG